MIWSVPSQETTDSLIKSNSYSEIFSGFCVECTSKYVVSATWLLLDKTTQPSYNINTSTKIIQKKAISNEVFFLS